MIHRFIDLPGARIIPYQRSIFDGTNSYDQTWGVPPEGGSTVQLTTRTTNGDQDVSPCASPDGSKVAYVSGTGFGGFKLRIVNADGSGDTLLDNNTGCASPVWHPDGSKILYRSSNGFRTINPDGTGGAAITISPAPTAGYTLRAATYNYDGSLIAFSVDDGLSGVDNTLWVMNADGSSAGSISITERTGASISSWSPVANRIAFVKRISSTRNDLVACDEDGTNVTTLVASVGGGIMRSAWVSDGSAVIHVHDSPSSGYVFSAAANGSGDTALSVQTHNSGITGPFVFGDRVYLVRRTTQDLVSVLPDGSDLRVEDTPDLTAPDFIDLRFLDGGGTYI